MVLNSVLIELMTMMIVYVFGLISIDSSIDMYHNCSSMSRSRLLLLVVQYCSQRTLPPHILPTPTSLTGKHMYKTMHWMVGIQRFNLGVVKERQWKMLLIF